MVDQNSSQAFMLGINMGMHAIVMNNSIIAPDRIRADDDELELFNHGVNAAYRVWRSATG